MAIYAIADLHLSFSQDKPMSIFGENWEGHSEKTKRACLYVFSIENPFDKSIPVRHVFVRGGEQVGKGKPNVAILGLSWQVY